MFFSEMEHFHRKHHVHVENNDAHKTHCPSIRLFHVSKALNHKQTKLGGEKKKKTFYGQYDFCVENNESQETDRPSNRAQQCCLAAQLKHKSGQTKESQTCLDILCYLVSV